MILFLATREKENRIHIVSNQSAIIMDGPKTRQEKKSKGKFYGKGGKDVYNQKHIRMQESLREKRAASEKCDNEPSSNKKKNKHK